MCNCGKKETQYGFKALPNENVFVVDLDRLARDMLLKKVNERLTYRDMGEQIGCHLQTAFAFCAGERDIGNDLFRKFVKWLGKTPEDYNVQKRLPGF